MVNRLKYSTERLTVTLYGRQPALEGMGRAALAQASNLGANRDKVYRIMPPSGPGKPGFQTISQPRSYSDFVYAEGVVLHEPNSAAMLQTRDCPTVILHNKATGAVVVTHAGRPALTAQTDCSACHYTVLSSAQRSIAPNGDLSAVSAFITGSICGKCFCHDQPGGEAYIQYFDRFGEDIFTDRARGALSLVRVIERLLTGYGVQPKNITHDTLCSKGTPWLSSKRGNKGGSNTVIVVRH